MNSANHSGHSRKSSDVRKRRPRRGLPTHMENSSSEEKEEANISVSKSQANGGVISCRALREKSFVKTRNQVSCAIDIGGDSSESSEDDDDGDLRSVIEARFGGQQLSIEQQLEKKFEVEKALYRLKGSVDLILYQCKIRRERDAANAGNRKEMTTHMDESSSEEEESESEQEVNESDLDDSSSDEEQAEIKS